MMTIAIEGIRVRAFHGVYEEEKISGNEFSVDVYLTTHHLKSTQTDRLSDTIDYAEVYQFILQEMGQAVDLLENLVDRIGQKMLAQYPLIDRVRIRISKLKPMGMELCDRTYVEMTFPYES